MGAIFESRIWIILRALWSALSWLCHLFLLNNYRYVSSVRRVVFVSRIGIPDALRPALNRLRHLLLLNDWRHDSFDRVVFVSGTGIPNAFQFALSRLCHLPLLNNQRRLSFPRRVILVDRVDSLKFKWDSVIFLLGLGLCV